MREQPLVSIITPSYNQAQYLEQTIISVLEQDYPLIEFLLVDGNSTDGSQEIIKKYASRITWWISEPDQGQAEAINKGLKRVKGEIVAWLNSDDYYLPGAVTKAVSAFQTQPSTSIVYGDVLAVDADGHQMKKLHYRQWDLIDLMKFNIIGQPSVFFRREILDKIGFLDPSLQFLLDHQLWLRLIQRAPMLYLPETLSAARFHNQSKNVAQASAFGEEAFRIIDWMRQDPQFKDLFEKNRNKIFAGAHRFNARYLLDGEQPRDAFIAYLHCLVSDPLTALPEWYRIIYSLVAVAGLGNIKQLHPRWRKKKDGE
jgi:glycosyltransferase involved in cell wall biosynthesis